MVEILAPLQYHLTNVPHRRANRTVGGFFWCVLSAYRSIRKTKGIFTAGLLHDCSNNPEDVNDQRTIQIVDNATEQEKVHMKWLLKEKMLDEEEAQKVNIYISLPHCLCSRPLLTESGKGDGRNEEGFGVDGKNRKPLQFRLMLVFSWRGTRIHYLPYTACRHIELGRSLLTIAGVVTYPVATPSFRSAAFHSLISIPCLYVVVLSEHLLPVGSDTLVVCGCGPNFNTAVTIYTATCHICIMTTVWVVHVMSYNIPDTSRDMYMLQV
jgi:hypothetical protein